MSTTTIRLPDDLKERVAMAAERAGMTSHALILDAIAERVEAEERYGAFHEIAERRYGDVVSSGKTIPWSEMRTYLEERIKGSKPPPPATKAVALSDRRDDTDRAGAGGCRRFRSDTAAFSPATHMTPSRDSGGGGGNCRSTVMVCSHPSPKS